MHADKLYEIIAEQFNVREDKLDTDTTFQKLDADYIDLIDLAMSMEDTFQVEVPDEALEKFKTLGDVLHYLEDCLG